MLAAGALPPIRVGSGLALNVGTGTDTGEGAGTMFGSPGSSSQVDTSFFLLLAGAAGAGAAACRWNFDVLGVFLAIRNPPEVLLYARTRNPGGVGRNCPCK